MTSINLAWDKNKQLFSFPVMILKLSYGMPGSKENSLHLNTVIYVDTGSSISSITDNEASKLGLDINKLPTEKTLGIGGLTATRYAKDLTFIALSTNSPLQAKLAKVAVLPSKVVVKREKNRGEYRETQNYEGNMLCLCGLDLLQYWHGKLVLDLDKMTGVIEIA